MVVLAGLRARWRSWLTLALVAGLTGGLVTAVAAGARRTDAAYQGLVAWSNPPDDLITLDAGGEFASVDATAVRRLPQVATSAPVTTYISLSPAQAGLMAPGDTAIPAARWHRKLLSGRLPDPGRPDEADVSFSLARSMNLRTGGTVSMQLLGVSGKPVPVRFRVVGVEAAPSEFPPQYGTGIDIVWTTPAFTRQQRGTLVSQGALALWLRGGAVAVPALEREITRLGGGRALSDYPLAPQAANTQRSIHQQAVTLWLLAGLLALLGLLVLGQLLARLTVTEAADYGTLRAMGMSTMQLTQAGLIRAAIIGAAGAAAGAVGAVAVSGVFPVGLAAVAQLDPGLTADWPALGAGMLATVATTVLCTAWPSWRTAVAARRLSDTAVKSARRARVAQAIRPVTATTGLRLALRQRTGGAAIPARSAIAASVVGVLGLSAAVVFTASSGHLLATPRLYGVTWDVIVEGLGDEPVATLERAVAADPQVASWAPAYVGVLVQVNGKQVGVITTSGGAGDAMAAVPVRGRPPRGPDEIVLGERTLAALGARVGDTVRVQIPGMGEPAARTVVGTAVFPAVGDQTQLGTGAELTTSGLLTLVPPHVPVPPPSGVMVSFRDHGAGAGSEGSGQQISALTAIVQRAGPYGVLPAGTPVDLVNFGQLQDLPLLTGLGLGGLAMLTIAHLLLTSVRRHGRELSVLRALGFTPRQVRATVGWMAATFAVVALVAGVPLGIAGGRLAWGAFSSQLGIAPVTVIPAGWMAALAAAVIALSVAVAAVPARSAARARPAAVLRAE
jgi:ABC-type lipoprotein release transport system permease subunit